jgi:tRNA(Ile)-lysidine synthase
MALLHALLELNTRGPQRRLIVAHLNHQLRGSESDADEAFLQTLHAQLAKTLPELEFRCGRLDVQAQAAAVRENLESVARRLRYHWLTQIARESGLHWVATGHTADDQAETVLHHLMRGSGLRGLRGIAPCREMVPGIRLFRPLLAVDRKEVLEYLADRGLTCRQDSSNLDRRFTRNRIRLDLLPFLARHFNPKIVSSLANLAEQAEEAAAQAEETAQALLIQAERPRAGELLVFDRHCLAESSRHRVRTLWRLVWEREGWPLGQMDYHAWNRLAAVTQGEMTAADLPGGIRALCRERVIQVGPR